PPRPLALFPYTTLFRSVDHAQVAVPHDQGAALAVVVAGRAVHVRDAAGGRAGRDGLLRRRLAVHEPEVLQRERVLVLLPAPGVEDRKSTRLNSSHRPTS